VDRRCSGQVGGSLLFVFDHVTRGSPDSFPLFAAADGTLAVATLLLLLR